MNDRIYDQKYKVIAFEAVLFVNLTITSNTTDHLIGGESNHLTGYLHVMLLNDICVLRYSPYQVKRELQFQGLLMSH